MEVAFTRKETVHKLGTESKGTPIADPVLMKSAPALPALKANIDPKQKG